MNMAESARHENMLSAARAPAVAAERGFARLEHLITLKLDASRAALLSEWTDRDMEVGNRLYLAGSVTIADILDHAADEAAKTLKTQSVKP